jgi:hypothetical protein
VRSKLTREHFFPLWLVERTQTYQEGIEWGGKANIPASAATVRLCAACNRDFGRELESPTAKIFDDIEAGRGVSDHEAEIIIRWLWKFEGLSWILGNPNHTYTQNYTLRQRVLQPIDAIRGDLVLCVALAERRDPEFAEGALGIDSFNVANAIFVSGVFSRVALMVSLSALKEYIPPVLSKYRLASSRQGPSSNAKLFFPATTLSTCTDAIGLMKSISPVLSKIHDEIGEELRRTEHGS